MMAEHDACQGNASWKSEAQAQYVAEGLAVEFGTVWRVVPHSTHFHVLDTGQPRPLGPAETTDDHQQGTNQ